MLKKTISLLVLVSIASLPFFLGGCGCGFDCNSGSNNNRGTTELTLGFSDALPEDLKQVVIEVDSITFRRTGSDDIVVDNFTIPELDLVSADTFQIDLLQYRGSSQLVVIDGLELDAGSYSRILIEVLGNDLNRSFVQEADDTIRELSVSSGVLSLPGTSFASSAQAYTVEFSLAQSLQEQSSGNSYLMTTDGIRLEDNATAASLLGRVPSSLFDSVSPCDEKSDPETGNRIYLYAGSPGSGERLGDVFRSSSGTEVPDDVVAPFAVAALQRNTFTGSWEYVFGFLPAGDYTLAFACDTATDDSIDFDDLAVPLPTSQEYPITLEEGAEVVCDLTDSGGSC